MVYLESSVNLTGPGRIFRSEVKCRPLLLCLCVRVSCMETQCRTQTGGAALIKEARSGNTVTAVEGVGI